MTNRALSPGINDRTTVVHALGHIAGVLCEAVAFELGTKLLYDQQGRVRVVLDRPSCSDASPSS